MQAIIEVRQIVAPRARLFEKFLERFNHVLIGSLWRGHDRSQRERQAKHQRSLPSAAHGAGTTRFGAPAIARRRSTSSCR